MFEKIQICGVVFTMSKSDASKLLECAKIISNHVRNGENAVIDSRSILEKQQDQAMALCNKGRW